MYELAKSFYAFIFSSDLSEAFNTLYSLSILKRQLERILSLIAVLPNDGCYIKQGATSYVYLQTFCVRQILRMRYWVMMPNEACIRMLVH